MTQETTIDVQKAYWWTQNKRGERLLRVLRGQVMHG